MTRDAGIQTRGRLTIEAAGGSLTGRNHTENQDSFLIDDDGMVFAVADGLGSRSGAKRASQLAVELLADGARRVSSRGGCPHDVSCAIQELFLTVNLQILDQGRREPQYSGMATTAVIAVRCDDQLHIAGVGDSRAYWIRHQGIQCCTEDHSMAQLFLKAGLISRHEAATSRLRHVLWQCLGGNVQLDKPLVEVFDLEPGDKVLLATDGLTNVLRERQLFQELAPLEDAAHAAERLLDATNAEQAGDDATCLALFVKPTDGIETE